MKLSLGSDNNSSRVAEQLYGYSVVWYALQLKRWLTRDCNIYCNICHRSQWLYLHLWSFENIIMVAQTRDS